MSAALSAAGFAAAAAAGPETAPAGFPLSETLLFAATFVWMAVAVWAVIARSRALERARRAERRAGFAGETSAARASEAEAAGDGLSPAQLRAVIDAAPFPVWLRDEAGDLLAANPAYVHAVEGADEAGVLTAQTELVDNALTGSTRESAEQALAAGERVHRRHFAIAAGQRCALAITDVPIAGGVASFAVDVTEAEDARAERSRLAESHAETLNKLLSPVAIFDSQQRLQFYNSAFAALSKLPEEWLSETPDHASLLEAMREKRRLPEQADFQAWKKEQLTLHQSLEPAEDLWHLPDGTTLRVVAQPHPLGGLLLLFEDVTDRLDLESRYNTLIAVQRETLDNLHEAVAVYGSDGRLKLHNPNYAAIWQLDPEFLEGEPHFGDILERARELVHEGEDWPTRKEYLRAQISERHALSGRWHRPDGRVLDYTLVPLPDGRMLTSHLDVTDSVRIEQALRERSEALETADRLKSEFVANMSYELRTPLNTIIGFSELIEGGVAGPLNDGQKAYLGYVLQAAGELRDLIDDILDLAVLEAGAMSLEIDWVNVGDLVQNVLAIGRDQARKAGLKLQSDVDAACGAIEADERRLTQALYNLVTNAIKYTPEGGRVTVTAHPRGDEHVEIIVSDTGVGIGEEDQEEVFKKFYTVSGQPARKGVGLGLALVQSFVELHGGRVDLYSQAQKGTTVTCILPSRQSEETAPLERAL